jgi:PAS domain S-box-containing protein
MNREHASKERSLQETETTPCVAIDLASLDNEKCLRILLVDDDPGFLETSKQILSMENNFKIDTATSVDEAFEKMEEHAYDAVVSDYEMPLKNGLDFLKELRERKTEISFILFTGKGREEVVVKALNLGADRYINKIGSPETVYCELADAIKKTVERKRSKQLLVESELKYRTVVEKSLQGILITLVDPLRVVFASAAMARILGYSVEELLSLSPQGITELIFQEDRPVFFDRMQSRFRGEPAKVSLELRAVRKDNSIVWLEAFSNRIDYEGQSAALGMFLDIDERKKADYALRESEDRYRELANSLPDIVFEADADGKLVFVNERAFEIAGYSREDSEKGMDILQFIVPEDRERAKKNIQRLLASGNYVPTEYKFLRKNGTTFPALITTVPQIARNKTRGLRGVVIDITERKKAEQALQESEGELRAIFDGASDGILAADIKTERFVFANPEMCKITGYSLEELLKLSVNDIHPEKDLPYVNPQFTRQLQGKYTLAVDIPILRKDKKVVYCDVNARLAKIGGRDCLLGFFRDITERKKAEEALRESEQKFKAIFEGASDGICATDPKTQKLVFANQRMSEITGYSLEELKKLRMKDLHPEKVFDFVVQQLSMQMEGERKGPTGVPLLRKDRKIVYCDINGSPVMFGQKLLMVGFFRDVTERKKAEEKLRESEDKYRTTFDSSFDALMLLDRKGFFDCNTSTLKMFGCKSVNEFTKYHPADLSPSAQPDGTSSMQAAITHINQAFDKGTDHFFWVHKRTDGTTFPADVLLTRIKLECRNVLQATVRDITEQKKAEEQLRENSDRIKEMNEKLRVVGSLTRHDVRNKLSAITGYSYILKKKHADEADIVEGLYVMEKAVKEVEKIFDFAKAYEQLGVEKLVYTDAEKTINEAAQMFSGLTFQVINGCHGLALLADSFLRQLFYNLIDNTRKYGETATTIRVHYEKADPNSLRLIYEDDGVGIPSESKQHLFKQGFSMGGSTGYGLYLIKKMIDVYGWKIEESGQAGKGAKFVMTIPKTNKSGQTNYQIR